MIGSKVGFFSFLPYLLFTPPQKDTSEGRGNTVRRRSREAILELSSNVHWYSVVRCRLRVVSRGRSSCDAQKRMCQLHCKYTTRRTVRTVFTSCTGTWCVVRKTCNQSSLRYSRDTHEWTTSMKRTLGFCMKKVLRCAGTSRFTMAQMCLRP